MAKGRCELLRADEQQQMARMSEVGGGSERTKVNKQNEAGKTVQLEVASVPLDGVLLRQSLRVRYGSVKTHGVMYDQGILL